jgi:hypothetical protein
MRWFHFSLTTKTNEFAKSEVKESFVVQLTSAFKFGGCVRLYHFWILLSNNGCLLFLAIKGMHVLCKNFLHFRLLLQSSKNSCKGNYVDVDPSNAPCLEDLEKINQVFEISNYTCKQMHMPNTCMIPSENFLLISDFFS